MSIEIRTAFLAATLALAPAFVDAQETQELDEAATAVPDYTGPVLDNIIVVAQKRAQSVQKVPISISTLDAEFIEDWAVNDINTATTYTPNVKVADAGYYIVPRIRGFGTNQNNKAFEPPAGVAIDGIPYTRLEYFTSALFDIERVEVLRGPQGTTFGKNTTAGLIHILSRNPSDEFEAFGEVQGGERERRRFEGAVGGPIIEDVAHFRIAALYENQGGFVRNSASDPGLAPTEMRGTERWGGRVKLHFPDIIGSDLKFTLEHSHFKATGAGIEIFDATPSVEEYIRRYDANSDFTRGNHVGTINAPDFREVDVTTATLDWRKDVADWSFVGIGGYAVLESEAALDIDGTPVPSIAGDDKDRSPTITAEVRVESPEFDGLFGLLGGHSNFLAGVNYQRREIIGGGIGYHFGAAVAELLVAGQADSPNTQIPDIVGDILEVAYPVVPPLDELPGTSGYQETAIQDFDQIAQAYGFFGQLDWALDEQWGIQFGFRVSYEEKKASFNQYYAQTGPNIILTAVGIEEYQTERTYDEAQFAPRLAVTYQLTPDIGIFVHWARGYRGGGFNAFAFRNNDEELSYTSETADDYGLDIKTQFFDGAARLNVSFFRLEVTDFQVLTGRQSDLGVGLGQSIVENAPKARSQGLEADFTWLPYEWLMLFSTLGYNDTEYVDFTFNGCLPDNPNVDGDEDRRCDVTGKPFPITPKLSGSMLAMATIPVSNTGLMLRIGGGFDYQTEQYTTFALDERYKQDTFFRWRLALGVEDAEGAWAFRVQGENLTDEKVTIRQGQVNRGYMIEGLEKPRTIFASFRYTL